MRVSPVVNAKRTPEGTLVARIDGLPHSPPNDYGQTFAIYGYVTLVNDYYDKPIYQLKFGVAKVTPWNDLLDSWGYTIHDFERETLEEHVIKAVKAAVLRYPQWVREEWIETITLHLRMGL